MKKREIELANYKFCFEYSIGKKKAELFDKLFLHANCPLDVSFTAGIIIQEYKQFYNECHDKYLAGLKNLCPREYERLMLSKKLLNFRSENRGY